MSDKPYTIGTRQKLVQPYFSGSGKDFENILVFHEGPELYPGMVFSTDTYDLLVVKENLRIDEDFFENIIVTVCGLMTNGPLDEIDYRSRELYYMYSAPLK